MSLVVKPFLAPNETHPITKDEVMDFCGKAFGMCYLEDDLETIELEASEESAKRSRGCIKSQHTPRNFIFRKSNKQTYIIP